MDPNQDRYAPRSPHDELSKVTQGGRITRVAAVAELVARTQTTLRAQAQLKEFAEKCFGDSGWGEALLQATKQRIAHGKTCTAPLVLAAQLEKSYQDLSGLNANQICFLCELLIDARAPDTQTLFTAVTPYLLQFVRQGAAPSSVSSFLALSKVYAGAISKSDEPAALTRLLHALEGLEGVSLSARQQSWLAGRARALIGLYGVEDSFEELSRTIEAIAIAHDHTEPPIRHRRTEFLIRLFDFDQSASALAATQILRKFAPLVHRVDVSIEAIQSVQHLLSMVDEHETERELIVSSITSYLETVIAAEPSPKSLKEYLVELSQVCERTPPDRWLLELSYLAGFHGVLTQLERTSSIDSEAHTRIRTLFDSMRSPSKGGGSVRVGALIEALQVIAA